ncbi:recombinase family protein [Methylobacterium iners]|uniref:Recombinase domain-containing protein n=1 Tax=Methylobacterium iners TaxID=418707 RepID=A0ABQ4RUI3_9HYPH|nr:hypothetical protein OCOJLMKI_0828 [Methylobacterium iners]
MPSHVDVGSGIENDTAHAADSGLLIGRAKRSASVNERRAQLMVMINAMRRRGNTLLVGIADELNRRGIPAPRGGQWSATQVARVL